MLLTIRHPASVRLDATVAAHGLRETSRERFHGGSWQSNGPLALQRRLDMHANLMVGMPSAADMR
jgi:hypothetical protein